MDYIIHVVGLNEKSWGKAAFVSGEAAFGRC